MRHIFSAFAILGLLVVGTGCAPTPAQLKKVIEENPDIVFSAIEKDPAGFMKVVQSASKNARQAQQQAQQDAAEKAMEEEFINPKVPELKPDRAYFGPSNAKITIVEYSDFQCPYCSRGYTTMVQVMKNYPKEVRVLYKHLPLDFHPEAMPAAEYYEAIALQSPAKAHKFHDMIFENQGKLKTGKIKFLKATAKKAGANMARLKKDLKGDKVKNRIKADMAEAKKFGFSGTPGFLVNGVSVKGAYPFPAFEKIIEKHLAKGK